MCLSALCRVLRHTTPDSPRASRSGDHLRRARAAPRTPCSRPTVRVAGGEPARPHLVGVASARPRCGTTRRPRGPAPSRRGGPTRSRSTDACRPRSSAWPLAVGQAGVRTTRHMRATSSSAPDCEPPAMSRRVRRGTLEPAAAAAAGRSTPAAAPASSAAAGRPRRGWRARRAAGRRTPPTCRTAGSSWQVGRPSTGRASSSKLRRDRKKSMPSTGSNASSSSTRTVTVRPVPTAAARGGRPRVEPAEHAAWAGVEHAQPASLLGRQLAGEGADDPRCPLDPPAGERTWLRTSSAVDAVLGQLASRDQAVSGRAIRSPQVAHRPSSVRSTASVQRLRSPQPRSPPSCA